MARTTCYGRPARWLGATLLVVLGACSDDGDKGMIDQAIAAVADLSASHDKVPLMACTSPFSGGCATLDVPLDWSVSGGQTITLYVNQIASSAHAKGQVWLLQGGPGGSGSDMVPLGMQLASALDVEVFTLDHRGVGLSSRLGCPQETPNTDGGTLSPAEFWPACLASLQTQWGTGLQQFTTSNAARDLKYAIDRFRKTDVPVFVYGVSYGTYWAQRFATIFPNDADGLILDSIVPMDGQFLSQFDLQGDKAAKALAEICKTDADCSAKLGADPFAHLQSIVALVGTGHCPALPITRETRAAVTPFLQSWQTRAFAFAALYRYERCNADDVAALTILASHAGDFAPPVGLFSQSLYNNIAYSELWETPPPTLATLNARYDAAVFPAGVYAEEAARAIWPTYPPDQYVRTYAQTSVPMLMLNGTLDMQTPIDTALLVKSHYAAANQTFVTIPNANHSTVSQSPELPSATGQPGLNCGAEIALSFLANPKQAPNTSCLNRLAPVTFSGLDMVSLYLFGTANLWSGPPTMSREQNRQRAMPEALLPLRRPRL